MTAFNATGNGTLINARLYKTKQQVHKDTCGNDIIVPIEIKIIKKRKSK